MSSSAAAMAAHGLSDHYGVFEVERGADEALIKKTYRKLVLQWHPDKHPTDREAAEERIRIINDAYETLGNPFKRNQYDQQLIALERRAKGFRLDTTGIQPRMCIPKEFMLAPIGHPEKFVRCVGMSAFVQRRVDVKCLFHKFFQDAKFSLWWLPEVNNMCRLRPVGTAGVGQDGGMNFNFALSRQVAVSEVTLSPGQIPESCNFIVVASPHFQGAFRFESAHFPGHYLAFRPPGHLRVIGGVAEENTKIDFYLVDYAKMFMYMAVEEVLEPAVKALGGDKDWVDLSRVCVDSNVLLYFQNVLQKTMWQDEDFQTFFEGRSSEWDYDAANVRVRIRSKHEQLASSLRRAKSPADVASAVSAAYAEVVLLDIDTAEAVLDTLSPAAPAMADVSTVINYLDAQKKILKSLGSIAEKDGKMTVSWDRLLAIYAKVLVFGGGSPDTKIAEAREDAAKELGEIVSDCIRKGEAPDFSLRLLGQVIGMPLKWKRCGEQVMQIATPLLKGRALEELLPFLRAAVSQSYTSLSDYLVGVAEDLLPKSAATPAAEVIEVMVGGGLFLKAAPASLRRVQREAPFQCVASVVATLGERGEDGQDLGACAAFLGSSPLALESLPPSLLLRLIVAATKSPVVADGIVDPVSAAAAVTLPSWNMDDVSKLLLAAIKTKNATDSSSVCELFRRAADVVPPKLPTLSGTQLVKIILAISKVKSCYSLLDAAAGEAANRIADTPAVQLVLLTQGVLPLGSEHPSFLKFVDHWCFSLYEASRIENLCGPEEVPKRRQDLEAKGQLSPDQVANLGKLLAPAVPEHPTLWKAFAKRLINCCGTLTAGGKSTLKAVFGEKGCPFIEARERWLKRVLDGKEPKDVNDPDEKKKSRSRDRSKNRDRKKKNRDKDEDKDVRKDRDRDRGREKEKDDRDRGREKEKDGQKENDRERDRSREREKERNGHKDKDRERDNSRERDKDKDRDKERERGKDKDDHKDKDRGKERDRDRDKEKTKEKDKPREKEKERPRDKEKERDQSRDRKRKARSRSKSRKAQSKSRSRSRSRERRRK